MIDWIKQKLPSDWKRIHLQPVKNWEDWKDYCKKEDPSSFEWGDLQLSAKKYHKDVIKNEIDNMAIKHLSQECEDEIDNMWEQGYIESCIRTNPLKF